MENLILSIVDIDTTQMSQQAAQSPIMQLLQDKSQIGCYVHMNHRLQDVMVLSDHSYQVKIGLPANKTSDEDRIQITIKRLAGGEEEEPLGK